MHYGTMHPQAHSDVKALVSKGIAMSDGLKGSRGFRSPTDMREYQKGDMAHSVAYTRALQQVLF
jgi:hypothetical protein